MTDLSRSLLAAAREGLAPDAAVAARVRAKVAAAVAAGATGATGAATALRAPAAKAATTSSVLLKLGAVLVTVGVVAGVAVVGNRGRTPEAPHLAVPASEPDDLRADVRVAACNDVDDPRVVNPAPARQATAAVPDVAAPARSSAPARDTRTADATAPAAEPASLSREVELIDLAMVSLRKNAPLAAIEAIRVFDRETLGQGQMAEEAAAIAIEAHCTLGDDVTDALDEFDRKWPSSAQRERLQTACFGKH
ncbi:MAG TPA: hypothetical protein VFS15_00590 [Kofleriaceae bacterium]|nr:hypothetical protein [Kofleriaceae bacterium]